MTRTIQSKALSNHPSRNRTRWATVGVRSAVAAIVLLGLGSAVAPEASAAATSTKATVVRWIDGDTVVTSKGTIRLIGIDTPERGTCGAKKARRWAKKHAPVGSTVRLVNPSSVVNRDKYDRKLRFVEAQGRDIGLSQIRHGAKARYDGRDGYDRHARQKAYRTADANHADYRCSATAPSGDKASYAPISKHSCPAKAPIKGNASSHIYHMPGQRYYAVTDPEECFATEAGAIKHGYRKAKV
jgi:endonuclease YncB( thermonuclease family)